MWVSPRPTWTATGPVPSPTALLELAARNTAPLSPAIDGTPFVRLMNRMLHRLHGQHAVRQPAQHPTAL